MDDNMMQAYARLSAHEFFLEVMYANWLARMAESHAKKLAADLRRGMRSGYVAADAEPTAAERQGLQVASDAADLADRFLKKVEARQALIRAELGQQ